MKIKWNGEIILMEEKTTESERQFVFKKKPGDFKKVWERRSRSRQKLYFFGILVLSIL